MLKRFFALSVGMVIAGTGAAQTFTFGQTYKVGDITTYTVNMTQSAGNVVSASTVTMEITKVYDNGDADMKESVSDMTMSMNDKPITVPAAALQPFTLRVNKFGSPQGDTKVSSGNSYSEIFEQMKTGISVGQTVPYSYSPPARPDTTVKGTIAFVSQDTTAHFHVVSDITGKTNTSHIEGDMSLDPTSKKLVAMDLTITLGGNTPGTSHMVMKLKSP